MNWQGLSSAKRLRRLEFGLPTALAYEAARHLSVRAVYAERGESEDQPRVFRRDFDDNVNIQRLLAIALEHKRCSTDKVDAEIPAPAAGVLAVMT